MTSTEVLKEQVNHTKEIVENMRKLLYAVLITLFIDGGLSLFSASRASDLVKDHQIVDAEKDTRQDMQIQANKKATEETKDDIKNIERKIIEISGKMDALILQTKTPQAFKIRE